MPRIKTAIPDRSCRRLVLIAALFCAGCGSGTSAEVDSPPPPPTDTSFERLPELLAGVQGAGEVVLYEGLPGEFWEPELRERDLKQKPTVKLHGYPFYEDVFEWSDGDAEQVTALLASRESYRPYSSRKSCGGFNADYCVEWNAGDAATRALISLECGEVKLFGPKAELHCDLTADAGKKLKELLSEYQANRPSAE